MSKHATLPLVLILLTLLSISLDEYVMANPYYEESRSDPPIVAILVPLNGTRSNSALLNFTVIKPEYWVGPPGVQGLANTLDKVVIEIDGKHYSEANGFDSSLATPFNYGVQLTGLTDGSHNLTVIAYATGYTIEIHGLWKYSFPINSSAAVCFSLDTVSPQISVTSIENRTYDDTDLPLSFTVDELCQSFSYVLDGRENVTGTGNITLAGLSYGVHNLTVYAWDASGNAGASETVTFTIAKQEPFPTLPVLIIVFAGVVVAGAGFLLIRKRGRGKTQ
jgi:hypothetical protein